MKTKPSRIVGLGLKRLGIAAGVACVAAVFLFLAAQTDWGRKQVAEIIEATASRNQRYQLELGGLEGLIPFRFRLNSLRIKDPNGSWFEAEGISVKWKALPLLRGRLHLQSFSADRVRIISAPSGPGKKGGPSGAFLHRFALLKRIRVDRFSIEYLTAEKAVLGRRAAFKLDGRIASSVPAREHAAVLRVEGLEGTRASAVLSASLKGEDPVLALKVLIQDTEEGLLGSLLGISGPLQVSLEGKAPLRAWKGDLKARLGTLGHIRAHLRTSNDGGLIANARGQVRAGTDRISETLGRLFGNEARFTASFRRVESGVAMESLEVQTGEARLRSNAHLDAKNGSVKGNLGLRVENLSRFRQIFAKDCEGELAVEAAFSGPVGRPDLDMDFRIKAPRYGPVRAGLVGGRMSLKFPQGAAPDRPGIMLNGGGTVAGFTIPGRGVWPDEEWAWSLNAEAGPGGAVRLHRLNVSGDSMHASLSGRLRPAEGKASLEMTAEVTDPKSLEGIGRFPLPGPGLFKAEMNGDLGQGTFSSSVHGTLRVQHETYASSLPPGAQEIRYRGRISLKAPGVLEVTDWLMESRAGKLSGALQWKMDPGTIHGTWRLAIPDLQVLEEILVHPVSGRAEWSGEISGSLEDFATRTEVHLQNFRVAGVHLDQVRAALQAAGLPSQRQGILEFRAEQAAFSLAGTAGISVPPQERELRISSLHLKGKNSELTGALAYDLERAMAQGTLQFACRDLSELPWIMEEKIGGAVSGEIRIAMAETGQSVAFDLTATHLTSPAGKMGPLSAQGEWIDVFADPRGYARLDFADLQIGQPFAVSTGELTLEGNRKSIRFEGTAAGRYHKSFEIKTAGTFKTDGPLHEMSIGRLNAQYGDVPVVLKDTSHAVWKDGALAVEKALLHVGAGSLRASGHVDGQTIALDVEFDSLPLSIFPSPGLAGIRGAAAGTLNIQGTTGEPACRMRLKAVDLALPDPGFEEMPTGTLEVQAEWMEGRLRGRLSLAGLSPNPIHGRVDLPLNLSLSPFALSAPPGGRINATLEGDLDLKFVNTLAGFIDQEVSGQLEAGFSLEGTVDNPDVKTRAVMKDGKYENFRSGTVLRDVELKISGRGRTIHLEYARAHDGREGGVSARGRLELIPEKGFPIRMETDFRNMTLVHLDDALLKAGGRLILSPTLEDPVIEGEIKIQGGEFRIPKQLPPDMVDLEIIEKPDAVEPEPQQKTMRAEEEALLDLNISIACDGHLFLRGRGLDSEWEGRIVLTGNEQHPILTGNFSVVRGHLHFLGKRFDIKEGTVMFPGKGDPWLNILAEAERGGVTAQVWVIGSPDAPAMEIRSIPVLPQDEILSYILFGRSAADLSPIQAVRLANAMNALTRGVDILERTRSLLGVDQLEIEDSGDTLSETKLSVGKYLNDRVYLQVERGVATESGNASVEIEVTPNVSVETELGEDLEGGVGVNWKWDY